MTSSPTPPSEPHGHECPDHGTDTMPTTLGNCPSCSAEITAEPPIRCPHCGYRLSPDNFGFISCVIFALRRSFTLRGRATRAEYWWFILVTIIISMAGAFPSALIAQYGYAPSGICNTICYLSYLLWIPSFCLTVRRLHDTGRSACLAIWTYGLALLSLIIAFIAVGTPFPPDISRTLIFASFTSPLYRLVNLASSLIGLYLFILTVSDSRRGPNKYGPSAKYPHA